MKKGWWFLVFIIALVLIFNFVKALWQSPQAIKRLKKAQEELQALKLINWQLRQEKDYRETDEFAEKEIRNKLMLGKEGELTVVLPEDLKEKTASLAAVKEEVPQLPPWRQWWVLFK